MIVVWLPPQYIGGILRGTIIFQTNTQHTHTARFHTPDTHIQIIQPVQSDKKTLCRNTVVQKVVSAWHHLSLSICHLLGENACQQLPKMQPGANRPKHKNTITKFHHQGQLKKSFSLMIIVITVRALWTHFFFLGQSPLWDAPSNGQTQRWWSGSLPKIFRII